MLEQQRAKTRNFRHPNMEIPAGTRMESDTGVLCHVIGPSKEEPGKMKVAFNVRGTEYVRHLWPSTLNKFRVNGRVSL